ncbi:hypothetical protein OMW55_11630 [Sphingomonas sp. BN140010]|uniref:Uncharacterized protein n=1 Tax=Sphingomonas arvum TaxID=2992113 RepID=A0ABT3JH99_9SPHN|nr:hypothetical protein [Sphingomonas sp. BN140010]MCW3798455.1 hypothetical protein [Sphingomonas sp. BN140010]
MCHNRPARPQLSGIDAARRAYELHHQFATLACREGLDHEGQGLVLAMALSEFVSRHWGDHHVPAFFRHYAEQAGESLLAGTRWDRTAVGL